jgi:hypothetical protein
MEAVRVTQCLTIHAELGLVIILLRCSCDENRTEMVAKMEFVNFVSCCTYNGSTVFKKKRIIISKCVCGFIWYF